MASTYSWSVSRSFADRMPQSVGAVEGEERTQLDARIGVIGVGPVKVAVLGGHRPEAVRCPTIAQGWPDGSDDDGVERQLELDDRSLAPACLVQRCHPPAP